MAFLIPTGDLKHFLMRISYIPENDRAACVPIFYKWAYEIALGVAYLHSKKIVHRDLAARNILLNDDLVCKVNICECSPDIRELQPRLSSQNPNPNKVVAVVIYQL